MAGPNYPLQPPAGGRCGEGPASFATAGHQRSVARAGDTYTRTDHNCFFHRRVGTPMNKLLGVLVGILVSNSVVANENDFRCLKSIDVKTPLRLQFIFRTDKTDLGYVIYQHGSGPIAVKKTKEKGLKKAPGGRPSEIETQWQEIASDGTGGTYFVVSQGALITECRYLRKKDGKILMFEEDIDASAENGCEWNAK